MFTTIDRIFSLLFPILSQSAARYYIHVASVVFIPVVWLCLFMLLFCRSYVWASGETTSKFGKRVRRGEKCFLD